ncbi:MAG TPA: SIMPL domain-containing protein [Thermodesulfovibrionales bacterium]|nr:SIMPL domain-containing protein [Thermodesulfovibrionales bacterium]
MRHRTGKVTMAGAFACLVVVTILRMSYAQELKEEKGTISVMGEAREYYPPDTAFITLGVETAGKTVSETVAENSKKSEGMVSALKRLISPAAGDSIKTSSYTVQPVYEYDEVKKKSILTGYKVLNQVTVRTKKIEMAGKIIDNAMQIGANQAQGISFTLSEEKEYCDGVIRKAAEGAKREAAFVARTLGTTISGIKSISPSCGRQPHPIYRQAVMETKMAVAAPEISIEAGDIAVSATVNVVFYLDKQ